MQKRPPFPYRKDGRRGRETYLQGADEVEAEPFAQARRFAEAALWRGLRGPEAFPSSAAARQLPPRGKPTVPKAFPWQGKVPPNGGG